jgi:hypothetical protein
MWMSWGGKFLQARKKHNLNLAKRFETAREQLTPSSHRIEAWFI